VDAYRRRRRPHNDVHGELPPGTTSDREAGSALADQCVLRCIEEMLACQASVRHRNGGRAKKSVLHQYIIPL
jgi:hypothetical protein